jgi:surface protein
MGRLRDGFAAVAVVAGLGAGALCLPATTALATDSGATQPMYRLYNPNSGEHFYTASAGERDALVRVGWRYEGEGWTAPAKSATPVYRLYNPNAGDHHYTTSAGERDSLKRAGWNYEGIGWYGSDAKAVPLYRQYNPNARTGTHNYTTSAGERDHLVRLGWRDEGVGWYGVETNAKPSDVEAQGQFGEGCTWRLHRGGKLEVLPTDGRSGTMGYLYGALIEPAESMSEPPVAKVDFSKVTSIVIDRGVKAPRDSYVLLSGNYKYSEYLSPDDFKRVPRFTSLRSIDASNLDMTGVEDASYMFSDSDTLLSIKGLDRWDVSSVKNMEGLFYGCSSLTDLTPLSGWNVSKVTRMFNMFLGCSSLTDLSPISGWQVSNVATMEAMFCGCSSLSDLTPIAQWDVSNVKDMSLMFCGCSSLSDATPLNSWTESSADADVSNMFLDCAAGIKTPSWYTGDIRRG